MLWRLLRQHGHIDPHGQDRVGVRMYVNGQSVLDVGRRYLVHLRGVDGVAHGLHRRVRHVEREAVDAVRCLQLRQLVRFHLFVVEFVEDELILNAFHALQYGAQHLRPIATETGRVSRTPVAQLVAQLILDARLEVSHVLELGLKID